MSETTKTIPSYRNLELDVIRWAEARGIIPNATLVSQARKSTEEAGELLEAAVELVTLYKLSKALPLVNNTDEFKAQVAEAMRQYRDAAGDVLVTLIIGCALADVDIIDCLNDAYNEIKDRKGYLKPDGTFVKES